ncbi:sensor histidine kinase RegB [Algicella marina]|uniref:histidine kinase n=1 Tax=Algicella marina TaxID=2683284 RepID=A0A6P1T1X9_9RHOB|nr:ActS/PrrB/RegB family redox-sensitive histidine kinase [Algicella marina]QHQ35987.1 ActS/PrrB/RegB family redox-sensitive histidine kinase [Algicella marina]
MTAVQPALMPIRARRDWVRLRTLIYLRWLAVLGQTIAIVVATQFLAIDLRLDFVFLLIAGSALFNIGSTVIHPENKRLNHRDATLVLLVDLAQLGALLYLSGGLANPFAVMVLVQTIISATVLTLSSTLLLGAVTLAMITLLGLFNIPLHTADGVLLAIPPIIILGNAVALSISVVFLSVYARRVTMESNSMSEALTATQLALEREQKLTALGGVVAAAAHELGTPLATIKLASAELAEELEDFPELRDDAILIRTQADRCRDILASMGKVGKEDTLVRFAPLSAVVGEAAAPHMNRGITVYLRVQGIWQDGPEAEATPDEPDISRSPEVIHGLRNLVQNAVDFAYSSVWIDMGWTEEKLQVRVGDDGRGYPADLIGRIGDPFVRRRSAAKRQQRRPGYQGMGLGLFIAKTLLERTGATLTFVNGLPDDGGQVEPQSAEPSGAIVEAVWQRGVLDVPRDVSRGPLEANTALTNS